jgi:hypothetical protein
MCYMLLSKPVQSLAKPVMPKATCKLRNDISEIFNFIYLFSRIKNRKNNEEQGLAIAVNTLG